MKSKRIIFPEGNSIIVYPNLCNKISFSIGCSISNKISFSISCSISNEISFSIGVLLVHTLSKCTYMFGSNGMHLWRYYCICIMGYILNLVIPIIFVRRCINHFSLCVNVLIVWKHHNAGQFQNLEIDKLDCQQRFRKNMGRKRNYHYVKA